MRLSEDKISHLSHLLCEQAVKDHLMSVSDPALILRKTKEIIKDYCMLDMKVDESVRKKISSYSRSILEGTREWDVMYRKHFEEEMQKRWK
ncbi:MAG: DUF507 family protein [Bdellovibrionales bacterium]|nr:DUF507 family protein [Bdellovibrionales bacterium]